MKQISIPNISWVSKVFEHLLSLFPLRRITIEWIFLFNADKMMLIKSIHAYTWDRVDDFWADNDNLICLLSIIAMMILKPWGCVGFKFKRKSSYLKDNVYSEKCAKILTNIFDSVANALVQFRHTSRDISIYSSM